MSEYGELKQNGLHIGHPPAWVLSNPTSIGFNRNFEIWLSLSYDELHKTVHFSHSIVEFHNLEISVPCCRQKYDEILHLRRYFHFLRDIPADFAWICDIVNWSPRLWIGDLRFSLQPHHTTDLTWVRKIKKVKNPTLSGFEILNDATLIIQNW